MRVRWGGHGRGNLNSQHLILRCGIVLIDSSLSLLSSLSSLVSLSVLWIYFLKWFWILFWMMWWFFSVFVAFGISWLATTSTNGLKFRQASNRCKRVLEAAKLAYANKTKEPITSQKLGSRDFWRIANSVPNKGKSAIPPLFNGPEVLSSASDKAKLLAENFSVITSLDDSGLFICFPF